MFSGLERTLERMNIAQSAFGFELVDLSAPIDAWDLEEEAGTPYLWAVRLADRLQSKTVELRVNLLTCITRHWLRDDDWLNLYAWWPDNRKPRVAIFSYAGLGDLPAEGPDSDRAIANAMVAALAGFFGNHGTHERGAKDCPLYFNKERDLKYFTAKQKFDRSCRNKVIRRMPGKLAALDVPSGVFT